MVVIKQSAQSLATLHLAVLLMLSKFGSNDPVVQTLVVTLPMVVFREFTEHDFSVEADLFSMPLSCVR